MDGITGRVPALPMTVCNAGTSVWGWLTVAVLLELGMDPYFHGESLGLSFRQVRRHAHA